MLLLILFAVLMSIHHSTCAGICTEDQLCLPVDPKVCDKARCLHVPYSRIDRIINQGAKITKWNILRTVLAGNCPIGLKFEQSPRCSHTNEVHGTFTHHYGESCNHSVSIERTFKSDRVEYGDVHVLTSQIGDAIYEDCIIYIQDGLNFVMRRCPANTCDGSACASIFTVEIMKTYDRSTLEKTIGFYNVTFNNDVVDCVI